MIKSTNFVSKSALLLTFLGLAAMFIASFSYRIQNPSLIKEARKQQSAPASSGSFGSSASAGMNMGMTSEMMTHITELMSKLAQNPNSYEIRMELANHFMEAEDAVSAMVHYKKASEISPDKFQPIYSVGVCQYRQGQFEEAAESFRQVLKLEKEYSAQFNLALLYRLHLNKVEESNRLLEEIVSTATVDEDLRNRAREVLATQLN